MNEETIVPEAETNSTDVAPEAESAPEAAPEPEAMPDTVAPSTDNVQFEGQHVTAILQDGQELRDSTGVITHYHCSLADGTTKHVPVTLFQ